MMRDKGASGPEFVSLGACWSHGPGDSHLHLAAALPAHTCPAGGARGCKCRSAPLGCHNETSRTLPVSFREAPRMGGMTSIMGAPAPCVIPRAALADETSGPACRAARGITEGRQANSGPGRG